jgi:hypothetical protein
MDGSKGYDVGNHGSIQEGNILPHNVLYSLSAFTDHIIGK